MSDPTMTNPNEPKISFNIKQPEVGSRRLLFLEQREEQDFKWQIF